MSTLGRTTGQIARHPVARGLFIGLLVLAVLSPHDRPSVGSMTEEIANTLRALTVYALPVLFGLGIGAGNDIDLEESRHLAGMSIVRQRRHVLGAHGVLWCCGAASYAAVCIVAWGIASPPEAFPVPPAPWVRALLYLALTAIGVISLVTLLCTARHALSALALALAIPFVHTALYFSPGLAGLTLAWSLWPTTAAGILARGMQDNGMLPIVLAATSLTLTPLAAWQRCRRVARRGPGRSTERLPSLAPAHSPLGRKLALAAGASACAGAVLPTPLLALPLQARPSAKVQELRGTDPVSVVDRFVQASRGHQVSVLNALCDCPEGAGLAARMPASVRASTVDGLMTYASPRLDRAHVVGEFGGVTIDFYLHHRSGRWFVRSVESS